MFDIKINDAEGEPTVTVTLTAGEVINVATAEGRERLAQLAAQRGPVFTVHHACDSTDEEVTA